MVFTRNKTPRRREMRRALTNGEGHWRRFFGKPVLSAMLWVYLFTLVAGLIALSGQNRTRYKLGQVVEETIVARVPFVAVDENKTKDRQKMARQKEPAVYNKNPIHLDRIRESLLALGRLAQDQTIAGLGQISPEMRTSLALRTFDRFDEVRKYVLNPGNVRWSQAVEQFMDQYSKLPLLRSAQAATEQSLDDGADSIVLRDPATGTEQTEYDVRIMSVETDGALFESRVEQILADMKLDMPPAVQRTVIDIVLVNPDQSPIYLLDNVETQKRRNDAAAAVEPAEMPRAAHQVLVPAGEELGRLQLTLLEKEQAEYDHQLGGTRRWLIRAGNFGVILLIGSGLLVYIGAYNPRILQNPVRGAALICLLLLAQALAVTLTTLTPQTLHLTATVPVLLTTMVLAIAYDRRFALAVGAITALLVLVSLKLSVGFSIILLTGVTLAASQLPDVRNRSTLVLAGFWTGAGMAAATIMVSFAGLSLQVADPLRAILEDAALVMLGAIITGLFVQGMMPAIERTFRVTTAMTLKDLNDASHPLLRRLAEEATGTYQHSLRIADMAEAAAETIGSNGLLCRVGAMYHDIGKVNKPEYFVENQHGGPNKHDKLRPAMSLLIIVGHVKDGIEMAKEFKLPKAVIHFIESHHGTTLVEYFYHAARKQSEDQDSPSPAEFEFRYPGPKPQTKEAAILMLCDGVEGAARALPEPTPVRLEQLVNKMMNKRLMDGQFDECQITLQELHKVEQAVVRTLTAIYHGRIAYPKSAEELQRESPVVREPQATAS